jgi:imidazole glycerol-phosphate synthase subunit HisH
MQNKELIIIDYGAGNIQSIQFAFERLGHNAILTHDVETIKNAKKVIFPGVGEASSAMKKLTETGLNKVIPSLTQPVLGICLGMQLMCNYTEEGNTKGLGIFDCTIKKFNNKVKVPQMGWNTIFDLKSDLFANINENEFMYLVHSFYACENKFQIATTNYGENYASALHTNNFYGVQFHPEKSGKVGQQILQNFLKL